MNGFISSKFHSFFGYILAAVTLASPWLFHFWSVGGAALGLPIFIGWTQLIMSVFTNNEGGAIKVFPVQLHLILDTFTGFILLVAPFLWGFCDKVYLPHLLLGLATFSLGLFTKPSPWLGNVDLLDSRGL